MTARRVFLSLLASIVVHALAVSMIGRAQFEARENKEAVIMVELQEGLPDPVATKALSSVVDARPALVKPTASNPTGLSLRPKKLTSYRRYLLRVKARIEHFWNYPPEALQGRPDAITTIRFVIGDSGSLLNRLIETSSGSDHLDRIALDAVQKAAPFEKIPADLNLPQLQVVARFQYTGR